jgi:hypothetical protein
MRTHRVCGLIAGVLLAALAGCTAAPAGAPAQPASSPPDRPSFAAEDCPVTLPAPVPASEPWRAQLFGADQAFGNGALWVGGLPLDGVLRPLADEIEPDGWVGRKFGWWRAVPGVLRITLRRLDAAAPAGRGDVPTGYGVQGFQSSGVAFPTPGCWEVTGALDSDPEGSRLTFVTLVLDPKVGPSPGG